MRTQKHNVDVFSRIAFVSVGQGIEGLGFRRVAAVMRDIAPQSEIFFVTPGNIKSLLTYIFPARTFSFDESDSIIIGEFLADYELVCFSSMSDCAEIVRQISQTIKQKSPRTFILYGGVHPTLFPDVALANVDAICIGEGEEAIAEFLEKGGGINGIWYNHQGRIEKNPLRPLHGNGKLAQYQRGYHGFDCSIYDVKLKKFRQFVHTDYTRFSGLAFTTIWSLGCPFSCTYCANSAFKYLDRDYLKVRYPAPEYVVDELARIKGIYPYINRVIFIDDNLMTIPLPTLEKFSALYKEKVNLPFCVFGIHPNTIRQEKIELLAKIGMNRTRMGVQSGVEKILELYQRNTSSDKIHAGASILAEATRKYQMIPPAYDIILDNPLMSREDMCTELNFLNSLPRPLTFNIFSLRIFPGTDLAHYFAENKIVCSNLPYLETRPTVANILVYIVSVIQLPVKIMNFSLRYVSGYAEQQKEHPYIHRLARLCHLFKRGIDHLLKFDFSTITGKWLYCWWKIWHWRKQK
jgi:radical SAM superfamily enzyme YgiQ (UPF0313 family)